MRINNILKFLFKREYKELRTAINILISRDWGEGSEIGFKMLGKHFTIILDKLSSRNDGRP